jgi:DNA-binding transcriptional MerR regulator
MAYTVKHLAELSGVTERTLRYYDRIALLKPSFYGDNGYRYYNDDAIMKLQQVLFFRELGFRLEDIKAIVSRPDFDTLHALRIHRTGLEKRASRLKQLLNTLDTTIQHLEGAQHMDEDQVFKGFSQEEEALYRQEASELYGKKTVDDSYRRWNRYSKQEQKDIIARGNRIHLAIADVMDRGHDSPEVQALMAEFHDHFQAFYDCTLEIFRGLGQMYTQDDRFRANYERIRPGMAEFMRDAMGHYCDVQKAKH